MKFYNLLLGVLILLILNSCKKSDEPADNDFLLKEGVFIVNQGTFTAVNASLAYYETQERKLYKEIFRQANGVPLGDVAQSITMDANKAWIVVNNSGVIHAVDRTDARVTGSITGLPSPRHMLIINENKAYVSDFFGKRISIVNPFTYEVVDDINTTGRSTEEMVLTGGSVYAANWSGFNQEPLNNMVLVIDAESNQLIDSIEVGIEPNSMVVDKNNHVWVLCTGGFEMSSKEFAALWKIDPAANKVADTLLFDDLPDYPAALEISPSGDTLYFLNNGVFRMSIEDMAIPGEAFISEDNGRIFEYLAVDPVSGDLFAGDPLDYVSSGNVFHYSSQGKLLNTLPEVGIVPGAFGFSR